MSLVIQPIRSFALRLLRADDLLMAIGAYDYALILLYLQLALSGGLWTTGTTAVPTTKRILGRAEGLVVELSSIMLRAYVMHSRRCVCLYDLRTLFGELVDKAAQELCKQDEFELDDEEMLRYCPTDTHQSPWRFDAHTFPWRD